MSIRDYRMVYQRSLKEAAAVWRDVSPAALYDLPYRVWVIVRDYYLQEREQERGGE